MTKTALVTTYTFDNNIIEIDNGFSYGRDLFPSDSDDIYIYTNNFETHKEQYISILEKYDTIYCSLGSSTILNILLDIIDERWVIGGPISLYLKFIKLKQPITGKFVKGTIPNYFNVTKYDLYKNYNPYFNHLSSILDLTHNNNYIRFMLNIGGSCEWGKCLFCSPLIISKQRIASDNLTYLLDSVNTKLTPLKNNKYLATLCTPSITEKQIISLIDFQKYNDSNIFYEVFLIPSKNNIGVLKKIKNKDCKNIRFLLGLECFSDYGLNIYNKNFTLKDVLNCCEEIGRLNAKVELLLMNDWFFTKREDVKTAEWFLKELIKRVPHNKIIPFKLRTTTYYMSNQWDKISKKTDFPLVNYEAFPLIEYKIVDIPKTNIIHEYNKEIENMVNNTHKLLTNHDNKI